MAKVSTYTVDTTFGSDDYVLGVATKSGTPATRLYGFKGIHNPVVVTVTAGATPSINTDNGDLFTISSLAAAITSMTTNLTGSPAHGETIDIEILDNGTARAITWGTSFASGPATLPTTTVLSKILFVKLRYNSTRSKWICVATGSEQ